MRLMTAGCKQCQPVIPFLTVEHLSHMLAGKQRGMVKAEPGAHQTRPALPQGRGLLAQPDCITIQQAKPMRLARPSSAQAAPAAQSVADKHCRCSPLAQPEGINTRPITSQGIGSLPGQQTRKQAPAVQERSSNGLRCPEGRKEAVILLEEADFDWDVEDLQKVQQRARDAPSALHPQSALRLAPSHSLALLLCTGCSPCPSGNLCLMASEVLLVTQNHPCSLQAW